MKKRLICALLAAVLTFALLPAALAAGVTPNAEQAAQVLAALDIMTGNENGDLMLDRAVTRAEFTKMTIAASVYGDGVGDATTVSPYPDVPYTHWAASYIQAAVASGYVTGYTDGTFKPDHTINLAEGVTMALRLLGYQNTDFSGAYPSGQMALYRSLKLDAGVSVTSNTAPLSRRDTMFLFYNLLTAKNKSGQVYLTTLGHSLNAAGEIDLVALINAAMEGPLVAEGAWQNQIPFSLSTAKVYRAGNLSSLGSISEGDVVYWSKSMRTLWAYTARATGIYEKAIPSAASPSSVTVAGKTYAVETAAAAFALSDLGSFRVGDSVTLLLGRSGGVAAVRTPGKSSSIICGMVTALTNSTYTDRDGHTYTAYTITMITTAGDTQSHQVDSKSYAAGDLVRVTVGADSVSVSKISSSSLTGRVNAAGTQLGNYRFADDVEILDTYGTTAMRVYPARLAGAQLSSGTVKYYSLNTKGEIDRLILADATGDLHTYGVLTNIVEVEAGMTLAGSYTVDVAGSTIPIITSGTLYPVSKGPCQLIGLAFGTNSISLEKMKNLTAVSIDSADGNVAAAGNQSYTLADNVSVYTVSSDGVYRYTSLERVIGGDYTLTGYYDKPESEGGRIRVILAR